MPLKFNRRVSDGFRGGLLWFLSWFRQERAERVSGGAGNGCYGKFWGLDYKIPHFLLCLVLLDNPESF